MARRHGGVVIAGLGHTAYGKLPGRSTISLNVEACREAIDDAGIEKTVVNALWVKVPTSAMELLYSAKVAEALGLRPAAGGVLDLGGASCIAMVSHAALAIEAGMCDVALVTCADNPRTGSREAYARTYGDGSEYGWFGVAAGYALIARRFLLDHGVSQDTLGAIAVTCRRHGAANPDAQLRTPITLDDYRKSPGVVDPLRRDDCALVSDGAAAVVVMSSARARELSIANAVPILGFGQGHTSWDVHLRPSLTETCAAESAQRAYAMAGITAADVDVAQLYDCFTITVLMQLLDYGFCVPGELAAQVHDGAGLIPINTSGGLLSETGMPGMQLVLEAVRQLRGSSSNQVKDAGVAVVSGQGGIMHTHASLVLGG